MTHSKKLIAAFILIVIALLCIASFIASISPDEKNQTGPYQVEADTTSDSFYIKQIQSNYLFDHSQIK